MPPPAPRDESATPPRHALGGDSDPARVLADLHAAQQQFYSGGDPAPVRSMLTADVVWTVPGANAIAGTYRGRDDVIDYFTRRRRLATCTLRLHPRQVLVGDSETIACLTDGTATIGEAELAWSTVGLYRLRDARVAACWLLPLDPKAFDRAWTP